VTSANDGVRRDRREPLWDRIERDRLKVGVFIALFVAAAALSLALMVGVGGLFLGLALLSRTSEETGFLAALPYIMLGAFVLGLALAAVHVARVLVHPESRLPGVFGAVPAQAGALPVTESALQDMAIAAGLSCAPRLWLIDDCENVNAFALGLHERTTMVGVTQGFCDRLSEDDQRAVFANLMARVCGGGTLWATVVSAIMGPIWGQRAAQFHGQDASGEGPAFAGAGAAVVAREDPQGVVGAFVLGFLGVVLTELLMEGHERAALAAAEKADAEGMLLLKDPAQMLGGLERVLEADNTVPLAGEAYSSLFFCWAGSGYAPEDDPEMERLGRLREVLGAEGAQDGSAGLRPAVSGR
jgi:Zn-dependent protease with chaperone function